MAAVVHRVLCGPACARQAFSKWWASADGVDELVAHGATTVGQAVIYTAHTLGHFGRARSADSGRVDRTQTAGDMGGQRSVVETVGKQRKAVAVEF